MNEKDRQKQKDYEEIKEVLYDIEGKTIKWPDWIVDEDKNIKWISFRFDDDSRIKILPTDNGCLRIEWKNGKER